ncbi:MAG: XRE family transcriptional regulator [Aliarcobacter sp.]|nr:XRE family transcriptional regulator [Aliarcobacter sp.]
MSNKEENIVKRVCRELNITQKELSDLMGVNDGTPAQWSSKGNIPDMAYKFMECLIENKKLKLKTEKINTILKLFREIQE